MTNEKNRTLPDLTPREWAMMVPIVAMAIFMGVLPDLFLRPMEAVRQPRHRAGHRPCSRLRCTMPASRRRNVGTDAERSHDAGAVSDDS